MQKAMIVRLVTENSRGYGWSFAVDASKNDQERKLNEYLADGWTVVQLCPMASQFENCCMVIVQSPNSKSPTDPDNEENRQAEPIPETRDVHHFPILSQAAAKLASEPAA